MKRCSAGNNMLNIREITGVEDILLYLLFLYITLKQKNLSRCIFSFVDTYPWSFPTGGEELFHVYNCTPPAVIRLNGGHTPPSPSIYFQSFEINTFGLNVLSSVNNPVDDREAIA